MTQVLIADRGSFQRLPLSYSVTPGWPPGPLLSLALGKRELEPALELLSPGAATLALEVELELEHGSRIHAGCRRIISRGRSLAFPGWGWKPELALSLELARWRWKWNLRRIGHAHSLSRVCGPGRVAVCVSLSVVCNTSCRVSDGETAAAAF